MLNFADTARCQDVVPHHLSIGLTVGLHVVMGSLFLVFHGTIQFPIMFVMLIGRPVLPRPAAAEGSRLTRSRIATLNISLDMFNSDIVFALMLMNLQLHR